VTGSLKAQKVKAPRVQAPALAQVDVVVTVQEGVARSAEANKLRSRTERMVGALGLGNVEISLALVDDAVIRELNKRWRRKDKPTDVLSFPMLNVPTVDIYKAAKAAPLLLGDIVVSVPTANRQAKARKRLPMDEMTTLVAHGLLHLIGFDHKNDDQEREMDAYVKVLEAAATNKKALRLRLAP
jgi:probable rRNA maturation factor